MKHESEMLAAHGTELNALKPVNVLQAAQADFGRKRRNAEQAAYRDHSYEPYAFHRFHVRKAVDAGDLLVRALMDPQPGMASDKFNTRLIYGNGALLVAAIGLSREKAIE